jgi:hypothetical protein
MSVRTARAARRLCSPPPPRSADFSPTLAIWVRAVSSALDILAGGGGTLQTDVKPGRDRQHLVGNALVERPDADDPGDTADDADRGEQEGDGRGQPAK